MKTAIGLGLIIVFLSSSVFAQAQDTGEVKLTTVISKIPAARILDWTGNAPTVDKQDGAGPQPGWQEQALEEGYEVCCPAGTPGDYVEVALNQSGENTVEIEQGTCLTIGEIPDGYVKELIQDEGEDGYDFSQPSSFEVETPTATIGVSGTVFTVIASSTSTTIEVGEGELVVVDKNPDAGDPSVYESLVTNQRLTIVSGQANQSDSVPYTIKEISNQIIVKRRRIRQIRREIWQIRKLIRSEDDSQGIEQLLAEIAELKQEKEDLKQEIKELKEQIKQLR